MHYNISKVLIRRSMELAETNSMLKQNRTSTTKHIALPEAATRGIL